MDAGYSGTNGSDGPPVDHSTRFSSGILETSVKRYHLFDTVLTLRLDEAGGSDLFFFTMHDDEHTSVRAGRNAVRKRGGQLLELTHEGTRNVVFQEAGQQYAFDPNRIFSQRGVRRTIQEQSARDRIPDRVNKEVWNFAEHLVDEFRLTDRPSINTLHNTMGDLTVEAYTGGGKFEQNASRVSVNPARSTGNFFLVTTERDYNTLSEKGWNVVLQDEQNVEEDGSLSVRSQKEGIPYVNVEAELGETDTQRKMISELYSVRREFPKT